MRRGLVALLVAATMTSDAVACVYMTSEPFVVNEAATDATQPPARPTIDTVDVKRRGCAGPPRVEIKLKNLEPTVGYVVTVRGERPIALPTGPFHSVYDEIILPIEFEPDGPLDFELTVTAINRAGVASDPSAPYAVHVDAPWTWYAGYGLVGVALCGTVFALFVWTRDARRRRRTPFPM